MVREARIEHDRGALRHFLERCERGSPVAVETIGNWYWIIDEIEASGCVPKLPELAVEREANRASFRVTHWVLPSAPARSA